MMLLFSIFATRYDIRTSQSMSAALPYHAAVAYVYAMRAIRVDAAMRAAPTSMSLLWRFTLYAMPIDAFRQRYPPMAFPLRHDIATLICCYYDDCRYADYLRYFAICFATDARLTIFSACRAMLMRRVADCRRRARLLRHVCCSTR